MQSINALAVAFHVLAALTFPGRPSTAYCSIDPFGSLGYGATTLFIGTATADSLPGGGPRVVGQMFHPDSIVIAAPRFSQLVRIERLSASATPALRAALKARSNLALVIPWAYGPDCTPGTYDGAALWMSPGDRGLFGAILRPREKWVQGIPTFDSGSPSDVPYPMASKYSYRLKSGPPLNADELMSFFDSIPRVHAGRISREARLKQDDARRRAVISWASSHPSLAARPPVAEMVAGSLYHAALAPFLAHKSPAVGTYRFEVKVGNDNSVVVFARSQSRVSSTMGTRRFKSDWNPRTAPPFGYYLLLFLAHSPAELDIRSWPSPNRQGFLGVAFEPTLRTGDSIVRNATADILGAVYELQGKPRTDATRCEWSPNSKPEERDFTPGTLVMKNDGSATLTVSFNCVDGTPVTIRGQRISSVVWDLDN